MAPYNQGKNRRELSKIAYFFKRYLIFFLVVIFIIIGVIATMKFYQKSSEKEVNPSGETISFTEADSNYLAMYEPRSYNALTSSDEDVVYLNQIIYSYLFKLDNTLNIVPDIVNDYSVDTENGICYISLRDDVMFSDGSYLTAEDVYETVSSIKAIGSSSPYFRYVDTIDYVYMEDNYNLIVCFLDPDNAALDNLVFPIISAYDYSTGDSFSLGSGQYSYSDYQEGKTLKLIPNEYYHGTKGSLPIEISFVRDREIIPGMITMDAVTAFLTKDQNGDNIGVDKSLKCIPIASSELEYLGFNCNNRFLGDKNVRRAIALAIDQNKIISDDYGLDAVISDSLYYPGFLGSNTQDGINFEPKTSSDILQGIGLKDIDEDGILENEESEDLVLSIIVNGENGSRKDAAHSISEDLKAIGIGTEIFELSKDEFNTALKAGDFDLYLSGIRLDKRFDLRDLYGSLNFGHYSGERIEELTLDLERAHSAEEVKGIFQSLKKELYDEMPYFGLCYKNYYFLSVETLDSKGIPPFYSPYENIGLWSWQKRAPKNTQAVSNP